MTPVASESTLYYCRPSCSASNQGSVNQEIGAHQRKEDVTDLSLSSISMLKRYRWNPVFSVFLSDLGPAIPFTVLLCKSPSLSLTSLPTETRFLWKKIKGIIMYWIDHCVKLRCQPSLFHFLTFVYMVYGL